MAVHQNYVNGERLQASAAAPDLGPREQGRYAAEFYTVVKTAYVNA